MRTGLYERTSRDDPRTITIEAQRKTLGDWSVSDPLVSSVVEYADAGVSGKIPIWERPAGKRLIEDVRAGRIECVAVAYADRFGRTLLDGLQAVKALEELGCKLVTVAEGWDSRRADSPLYFQFRMMIAEEEHRRIAERMATGKRRAMARDNAPPGGLLTFGYRFDSSGRYVVDPIEGPIVQRIFEMAIQGYTNTQILAWVRSTGVPSGTRSMKRNGLNMHITRPAEWTLAKILRIQRNRTYVGERRWGSNTFACAPLVDVATFDRVQQLNIERRKTYGDHPWKGLGICSGLFTCGMCGGKYYMRIQRHKYGRWISYACDSVRRRGCGSKVLKASMIDEIVWGKIEEFLSDPEDILRRVILGGQAAADVSDDLASQETAILAEMSATDEAAKTIWAEQAAKGWPLAWVTAKLDALLDARKQQEKKLDAVRQQRTAIALDTDSVMQMQGMLVGIRISLTEGVPVERKRAIVDQLVSGGVVHTIGSGRAKKAEIDLHLRWGDVSTRKVSQDCYQETLRVEVRITLDSVRKAV